MRAAPETRDGSMATRSVRAITSGTIRKCGTERTTLRFRPIFSSARSVAPWKPPPSGDTITKFSLLKDLTLSLRWSAG